MGEALDRYLELEKEVERVGAASPEADEIRDVMDRVWLTLSDEEIKTLDERK